MTTQPPPTDDPLIDVTQKKQGGIETEGMANLSWILFFNQLFQGDAGDAWVPNFRNLTIVGGVPTVNGRVYQISRYLSFFVANLICAPGGNTSAVAGTTLIDNFPLRAQGNGVCFAVSGLLGAVPGMVDFDTNGIYVPTWNLVTVPITILGIVEAK